MPGPRPHSAQIAAEAAEYLDDANRDTQKWFKTLKSSSEFRKIYSHSLAADAVVSKLSNQNWRPSSNGVRWIIRRVPFLVAAGQISTAMIELRRLVELSLWVVYFTDHPVEWKMYVKTAGSGFHPSIEQPIMFCAHKGVRFYLDYANELFEAEPSKIASEAVANLRLLLGELNSVAHPSLLGVSPQKRSPFEDRSESSLQTFQESQRGVFRNLLVVLAAAFRQSFRNLPPAHRHHFDTLLGGDLSKRLLSGPFGLPAR